MGKPKYVWKPLIRKNDVDGLAAWLDAGGNVDEFDPAMSATPLLWAVMHGQLDCVRCLVERGAKLDRALNVATATQNKPVIRYLLTCKPSRKDVADALDMQETEFCEQPDEELESDLRKAKRAQPKAKIAKKKRPTE